jgi:hypothetical protein
MAGIVVFSCPKFAWMKPLWFRAWERAWPDCPYPVEWVGNEAGEPWGACYLRWAQRHTGEPWLVMLDDYMVQDVDRELMATAGEQMRTTEYVGCMRLKPTPGPTIPYHPDVGQIDTALAIPHGYPVSLQPSIWVTEALAWHVEPHYSPWQVEIEGSKKAPFCPWKTYGTYKTAVGFRELSVKGVIQEDTLEWVNSL